MAASLGFLHLHPFVRAAAHDKVLGTIVGSALGDAIGLYTEFLPGTEALKAYPEQRFSLLKPTEYRADSHRVILSYLHNRGQILPDDFASRLRTWCRQGLRCLDRLPLGLGQTVGAVALNASFLANPSAVATAQWLKQRRHSAANGSLMRTHPLGIMCVGHSLEDTFQLAADLSRVTHVDPRCVLACCIATGLVRGLVRGEVCGEGDVDALMAEARAWVVAKGEVMRPKLDGVEEEEEEKEKGEQQAKMNAEDPDDGESGIHAPEFERYVAATSFADMQLDDSHKMGYVYKCLGSAVLALRMGMRARLSESNVFERIITELVMCGGDADTNACVAGALLGAWLGYSRMPVDWREGLANGDWLLRKSEALSRVAGIAESRSDGPNADTEDPDTALDGGRGMLTEQQMEKRERDLVYAILKKQQGRRDAEAKAKTLSFGKWVSGIVGGGHGR